MYNLNSGDRKTLKTVKQISVTYGQWVQEWTGSRGEVNYSFKKMAVRRRKRDLKVWIQCREPPRPTSTTKQNPVSKKKCPSDVNLLQAEPVIVNMHLLQLSSISEDSQDYSQQKSKISYFKIPWNTESVLFILTNPCTFYFDF